MYILYIYEYVYFIVEMKLLKKTEEYGYIEWYATCKNNDGMQNLCRREQTSHV